MVTRIRKEKALNASLIGTLAEEVGGEVQAGRLHFPLAFVYAYGLHSETETGGMKNFYAYRVAVFNSLYPNALGGQNPEQAPTPKVRTVFQLTDKVIRAIYEDIQKGWPNSFNTGFAHVVRRWYPEVSGNSGLRALAYTRVKQYRLMILGALAHERTLNAPAEKD